MLSPPARIAAVLGLRFGSDFFISSRWGTSNEDAPVRSFNHLVGMMELVSPSVAAVTNTLADDVNWAQHVVHAYENYLQQQQ